MRCSRSISAKHSVGRSSSGHGQNVKNHSLRTRQSPVARQRPTWGVGSSDRCARGERILRRILREQARCRRAGGRSIRLSTARQLKTPSRRMHVRAADGASSTRPPSRNGGRATGRERLMGHWPNQGSLILAQLINHTFVQVYYVSS
jgi:hypothetical protein